MAASAFSATTGQYSIWIDEDKIYCDEAKLKDHLIHKLSYNYNDAIGNGRIKYGLLYFWSSVANTMSTEAIRVLLHSLEHSQLIHMLSYQNECGKTALHRCADNKNNELIKVVLDSVSEDECNQLLSITDNLSGWTPLHMSSYRGDTESVRVMQNHVNQDMRCSLLQISSDGGNTPLHLTSYNDHTDIIKVIHESVTQAQWINLLQMRDED